MAAPAQRLVPEALTFASALLATAIPPPATTVEPSQQWARLSGSWSSLPASTPALSLVQVLQSPSDDSFFATDAFKASLLLATLGVVSRAADVFAKLPSLPELFAPALATLKVLSSTKGLPQVSIGPHLRANVAYAAHVQCSLAPKKWGLQVLWRF